MPRPERKSENLGTKFIVGSVLKRDKSILPFGDQLREIRGGNSNQVNISGKWLRRWCDLPFVSQVWERIRSCLTVCRSRTRIFGK